MQLKLSVVIPTYNRVSRLKSCLESLESQSLETSSFEVIVVVDGSTDDTEAFLDSYRPGYRLRSFIQANAGLSAARNRGNREAAGELILCLDDDMVASPELLSEHLRAHAGHERLLVQGGLELHPSVPRTPYIRYEERLRLSFARQMSMPGVSMDCEDVSGGNMSLSKELLDAVGGFNADLKGLRNTDGELAYRLSRSGVRIIYHHAALASMTHTNDLETSLEAATLYGRSYVFSQREFPETIWTLSPLVQEGRSLLKRLVRRLYLRPRSDWGLAWFEKLLRRAIGVAESLRLTPVAGALYRLGLDYFFWKGVHAEADSLEHFLPRAVPILCYHNVSDQRLWRFRHYILPVKTFARQMRWLEKGGYQAIGLEALEAYLQRGTPLPPRPVVITFDDGYQALKANATPLLAELGIPHTHFLTTGKLGGTTDWVETAPDLPLLSEQDVREMTERYGEVADFQPHGHNHASMEGIGRETARSEVLQSIETVEELTGRPARFLAYPYGDYDDDTPGLMRELPLASAFTVNRGLVRPGQDPFLLPRVEVFANDFWFDFRFKLRLGWSPLSSLRVKAGGLLEQLMALAARARRTGPKVQDGC